MGSTIELEQVSWAKTWIHAVLDYKGKVSITVSVVKDSAGVWSGHMQVTCMSACATLSDIGPSRGKS